ncbi:MAG TPA: GNAT family N-acetyltransferase [Actinomycetota bacterium]|nr:GNAT family N-acetyltransferase [Actinomycetota bacterium]
MSERLDVRRGTESDLAGINDIYNHYVVETHVTFDVDPIDMDARRRWFEGFADEGPHRLFVADAGGRVIGYAASRPHKDRPGYRTTVETMAYCHPDATGRGVGSQLYERLFAALDGQPLRRAVAGVALPNDASLALHRRFGFVEVGTFSEIGYKLGRYWDVTWLEKAL